ncbi:hypothetical protein HU200_005212 [Digitaria exilis]|uniref:Uncharacterized protein n=1 Tax=Digitaria exilis TaxID=1010633 RepID=A0A835FTA6_9POAL|nr:hypothetical protein HU200_005212 [Digitaria exilis]
MATLPIKPLDGADGYLRWKESMLLRLHSVDVAHVLSDEPPAASAAAAAKKWARDDAVCRGHILHALSDRIFPDYVRFEKGASFLEQLAHAEALAATSERSDTRLAYMICNKLPGDMATLIRYGDGGMSMKNIWETARFREELRIEAEDNKRRQVEEARADHVLEVKAGHRHRHRNTKYESTYRNLPSVRNKTTCKPNEITVVWYSFAAAAMDGIVVHFS